jgi:hypothetical protein
MKHRGTIKPDGSLVVKARSLFDEGLRLMAREKDLAVIIEVKPEKKYRSVFQNSYYWGIVITSIATRLRELGHDVDKDLTHEFLKGKFLYTEMVTDTEVVKIPRKTSELTTTEFEEYVEMVKQFAAETLNVFIPDPNDDEFLDA